jgi:hypothetical protein
MLWVALRWNWANTLPIAGFCLLTIITIGQAWSTDAAVAGSPPQRRGESIVSFSDSPADLHQPVPATLLAAN